MSERDALIARKQEILRDLTRAQRQIEAVRHSANPHKRKQRQQLENEIEQLMAEQYRLRIAIDRAK